jgi:hypothetical protein
MKAVESKINGSRTQAGCRVRRRSDANESGGAATAVQNGLRSLWAKAGQRPASYPMRGHLGVRRPKGSDDGAFGTETGHQVESRSDAKESGGGAIAIQNGRRSLWAKAGRIAPYSANERDIAAYRGLHRREKNKMISRLPKISGLRPGAAGPGVESGGGLG